MATGFFSRRNIFGNSINSNVLKMEQEAIKLLKRIYEQKTVTFDDLLKIKKLLEL